MNIKGKMLNELVDFAIEDPVYNTLRTQQQLGYIVFSQSRFNRDAYGILFIVQSSSHCSEVVCSGINQLLETLSEKFRSQTEEEFQKQVNGLLVKVSEKDYHPGKVFSRHLQEISSHKYIFDRQQREIEALKSIKKEELADYFDDLFFKKSKRVEVVMDPDARKEANEEQRKKNEEAFFGPKGVKREKVTAPVEGFKKSAGLYADNFKAYFAKI